MTAKEKQTIIRKIKQREAAQEKANLLQREIDKFFNENDIECDYYLADVVLFCEPQTSAAIQAEKVLELWRKINGKTH